MWLIYECSDNNVTELKQFYNTKLTEEEQKKIFIPTYDCMKKYQGSWHMEQRPIFPDCLFIECKDREDLQNTLNGQRWASMRTDIISDSIELDPEQEMFLKELMLPDTKRIPMSTGYIKDGVTYVTHGPLQGKEKLICKIDRHKRLAKVMMPLSHGRQKISAGLEIISKN